jgi:hypothetical protein
MVSEKINLRREKREKKNILEAYQNFNNNTTSTIKKYLNKKNLVIPGKLANRY